jgi:hypothetical protein
LYQYSPRFRFKNWKIRILFEYSGVAGLFRGRGEDKKEDP